jgi:hypothetical protein
VDNQLDLSTEDYNTLNASLLYYKGRVRLRNTMFQETYRRHTPEASKEIKKPDLSKPGAKDDSGKNRMGLLMSGCPNAIKGVAEVLTFGANKYSANGWQTVPNAVERYKDALYRHLNAYERGELVDEESGLSHLLHATTNLMFIIELSQKE